MKKIEGDVSFDDALLLHVFDLFHSPGHVAQKVVDDFSDDGSHHFSKSVVTEQFHDFASQWDPRFPANQPMNILGKLANMKLIYRATASLSYLAVMGSDTKCDILSNNNKTEQQNE